MRYFIHLQYNGTNYHGWQKQPNVPTVQGVLDKALSTYLRAEINSTGSGRTDTGVHAKTQVAHFDFEKEITQDLSYKLNSLLPNDIVIDNIHSVSNEMHARFSPTSRAYQYFLSPSLDPFNHGFYYHFYKKIDYDLMNEAAKKLFEHTDFESFSKIHTDVNTFNCKISKAYWREENNMHIFYIKADRFLRGMVRTIVGTLLEVGLKNISTDDFNTIILQKSRAKAGRSVPAEGLFLWEVNYPD